MEKTIEVLNKLVEEKVILKYAIGGAMAAMFFAEPVSTFDLDIFIILPEQTKRLVSLSSLYERLSGMGYIPEGECVMIAGVPVQFLPVFNDLVKEALEKATMKKYASTNTCVIGLEYLLAIAVQTGRKKDRERVRLLLDEAAVDRDSLDLLIDRYSLRQRWNEWTK